MPSDTLLICDSLTFLLQFSGSMIGMSTGMGKPCEWWDVVCGPGYGSFRAMSTESEEIIREIPQDPAVDSFHLNDSI